ncbi:MAG: recombinase family protein, partial [Thermodesulfobacteriota bacterium]|nr:recombinase family protein [Thermodesulfobacteriota bacterium]
MNAAIYIRKSREDKSKPSHRLTVQRQQLPAYAQSQGWTPTVYDDGHASAARGKTEDLAQRNQLETDIKSGKIQIILTIELSRLSRDDSMQDYTSWLHLCSQNNVKLATMSRTLDPAQHSDWMLLLMEGGFSSVEMKVLQGRMAEG